MPEIEYWRDLFIEDGLRIEKFSRVLYVKGKVVDFVFQITINDVNRDKQHRMIVRRYDCAHGFAHCDVYNALGEQIRKETIIAESIDEASRVANLDIDANAYRFVEEFRASSRSRP
jgi:hypothetical protein